MDIQTIILGFLVENSLTGYELKSLFNISFSFFSGISYGSIYPALKKMEQNGLITTKLKIQKSAPNKKICTITEKGKKKFHQAIREPLAVDRFKNAFLSRLFFFSYLSPSERKNMANQYLQNLEDTLKGLEALKPTIENVADPFQLYCLTSGTRVIKDFKQNILEIMASLDQTID